MNGLLVAKSPGKKRCIALTRHAPFQAADPQLHWSCQEGRAFQLKLILWLLSNVLNILWCGCMTSGGLKYRANVQVCWDWFRCLCCSFTSLSSHDLSLSDTWPADIEMQGHFEAARGPAATVLFLLHSFLYGILIDQHTTSREVAMQSHSRTAFAKFK
eukprot:1148469-Pelagomonas_calceolata.AAC.5